MKKILLILFIWVFLKFDNLADLTNFLNKIPRKHARTAKIVCEPYANALICRWWLIYNKESI